ncbi:MAG: hypothetical protein QM802_05035 [Agriterribacter sp.]
MWKIIKEYYLVNFIVFFIVFGLRGIATKSPNTLLENFLIVLIGSLILSALVGTIYFYIDARWGPNKREKRFSKVPFIQLVEKGFKRTGDFLIGTVDGYTVMIMFVWPLGQSAVKIAVLFDPASLAASTSYDDIEQIEKRHKKTGIWKNQEHEWTRNSVSFSLGYNFNPPSAETVIAKAQEMTDMLIKENIKPVSIEKLEDIAKGDVKL